MTTREQISESFFLSLLLSFSGGFQDAYTYMVRDQVFANAQTGNIVLMSSSLINRQWQEVLRYLLPVAAFALGVFAAENIQHRYKTGKIFYWRQIILIAEIITMLAVGFMPAELNWLANISVSFACAMQVQSFRAVCGNAYASTMCIGNLRSGTAVFSSYLRTKDKSELKKAAYYFSVILVFALGAGLGGWMSGIFGEYTIWISCAVLTICFAIIHSGKKTE